MLKLTQEDFSPVYMNINKHENSAEDYPKIVQWLCESPIVHEGLQAQLMILQRQMEPDDDWEFLPTFVRIDAADRSVIDAEKIQHLTARGTVTLESSATFDDAIEQVFATLEALSMNL